MNLILNEFDNLMGSKFNFQLIHKLLSSRSESEFPVKEDASGIIKITWNRCCVQTHTLTILIKL